MVPAKAKYERQTDDKDPYTANFTTYVEHVLDIGVKHEKHTNISHILIICMIHIFYMLNTCISHMN